MQVPQAGFDLSRCSHGQLYQEIACPSTAAPRLAAVTPLTFDERGFSRPTASLQSATARSNSRYQRPVSPFAKQFDRKLPVHSPTACPPPLASELLDAHPPPAAAATSGNSRPLPNSHVLKPTQRRVQSSPGPNSPLMVATQHLPPTAEVCSRLPSAPEANRATLQKRSTADVKALEELLTGYLGSTFGLLWGNCMPQFSWG